MKRIGFIGYGLRSETMMKSFRSLEADNGPPAAKVPLLAARKRAL